MRLRLFSLGIVSLLLSVTSPVLLLSFSLSPLVAQARTWEGMVEATRLLEESIILYREGRFGEALQTLRQALAIYKEIGDRRMEGTTLNNIGEVYRNLGRYHEALEYYQKALVITKEVGKRTTEGTILNNIGAVYYNLGKYEAALDSYQKALVVTQEVRDIAGVGVTINNIGTVYNSLGEYQKALDYYQQALAIRRAIGDGFGIGITLNSIGTVYDSLGEYQKALDYYRQALAIRQKISDRDGESTILSNIGAVYDSLGEYQVSLDYQQQALAIQQKIGVRAGAGSTLTSIGAVYNSLGEYQRALDYYRQALAIQQGISDRAGEGTTLKNVGKVYYNLGEYQVALDYYQQALAIWQEIGNRAGKASTLYNLAYLERKQDNLNSALTHIEAAITIIEDLRIKIGSQELRASYFATVQDYYKFYVDLLMQLHQQNPNQGYDALALHTSERARARSLVELLTEANANIRQGVDPKLLEQERTLTQQLNALERRRYELSSGQHTKEQLDEIKQQSQSLLTQLEQLKAQIRVTSPRYAALKYPKPLYLQEIQQQVLDDNTLLLEYSLGQDRSYLWAVSKTSITSYVLPKQSDIKTAVETFRKSVTKDSDANLDSGLVLSQMLLAPVANQLSNKRLLIVGDGELQYVPFAALPVPSSPTNPLLVQNEIVTLSSASTVASQRQQLQNRSPVAKKIAVIADPIFALNDPRFSTTPQPTPETPANDLTRATRNLGLGDSGQLLDRLKYSRDEADKILALVPEAQRFQAFDFNASRQIATNPDLAKYQIIHLATHGLLDPINPELSGIVLSLFDQKGKSQNGFLRLQDIFNLNLPTELVVLSACETGLGKDVKGEGLVGLTRGFMYAGARRVVVSLWRVNDPATSELMAKFYQKMLQGGQNPVKALREAQLEMWNSQNRRSPYYWAAFTVQGDWQ